MLVPEHLHVLSPESAVQLKPTQCAFDVVQGSERDSKELFVVLSGHVLPLVEAKKTSYRQPDFVFMLKKRPLVTIEVKSELQLCHPSDCGLYDVVAAINCKKVR